MTSVVMEEFLPAAFGPPWVRDAESTRNLCGLKNCARNDSCFVGKDLCKYMF